MVWSVRTKTLEAQGYEMWLNKVLAVPLIGVQLAEHDFDSPHARLKSWTPSLGEITEMEIQTNQVRINTSKGMIISGDTRDISVRFLYSRKEVPGEYGLEQFEYEREFTQYETLLEEQAELIVKIVPSKGVQRIGVLAHCEMTLDSIPPGVVKYLERFGPKGKVINIESKICLEIDREDDHTDRCHHIVSHPGVENKKVKLVLDYQRVFDTPVRLSPKNLASVIDRATAYFEEFGSGLS